MAPTYPDYDVERFLVDVTEHEMVVLHDEDLYRHLRFVKPGTGFYWFDLVTWPGRLAITGDMGSFLFARLPDMFEFFRGKQINPDYWAEKMPGGRDSVMEYSQESFEQQVREHVADAIRNRKAPRGTSRAVLHMLEWGDVTHEGGARSELETFEHKTWTFGNTWEWNFRDWSWQYLWACHAIRWGIEQYDQAQAAASCEPAAVSA